MSFSFCSFIVVYLNMASTEASTSNAKPTSSKRKYNTNCCVYGCHSRKGADRTIHFHAFPEKESGIVVKMTNTLGQEEKVDKRKAWERVLLMGKPVTQYMRVCSKHFKTEDYLAKGGCILVRYLHFKHDINIQSDSLSFLNR